MIGVHAAEMADIDGDGIPEFITGKRGLSHLNSYTDANPSARPCCTGSHGAGPEGARGSEFRS